MSHPERYVLILVLALMVMHESPVESTTTALGTVSIVSSIPDAFLTIHCRSSSGEDLGTKSIPFNGKFTWNVSVGGKNEVYDCGLVVEGLHGRFSLFDAGRDWSRDRCVFLAVRILEYHAWGKGAFGTLIM
ncbi:hypothetical protein RHSIM_Rhsim02G0052800 [Rhododendron simsii]|uniref:S-protein homolog n=1 Tax=Rhododendron simsii TaxID=118357 RepID=A0A834HN30_RHOSS|nr:hypothetical protein RHSIM_Rhsim02G0052800 [Rhododendron simsii]